MPDPIRGESKGGRAIRKVRDVPDVFHSPLQIVDLLVLLGGTVGVNRAGRCEMWQGWTASDVLKEVEALKYPTGVRVALFVVLYEIMGGRVLLPEDADPPQGVSHGGSQLLPGEVEELVGCAWL